MAMATVTTATIGAVLLLLGAAATIIYVLQKRNRRRFATVSQERHELQPISIADGAVATSEEEHTENVYDVYGSVDNIVILGEDINEVGGKEARIDTSNSQEVLYENVVPDDANGRDSDRKSVLSFYADEVVIGEAAEGGRL